jgi:hypothetical protein
MSKPASMLATPECVAPQSDLCTALVLVISSQICEVLHDITLETKLSLQQAVLGLAVLATVRTINSLV